MATGDCPTTHHWEDENTTEEAIVYSGDFHTFLTDR